MKVGEVCLLTSDVIRLSNFYKMLLYINNGSDDNVHQFIISEETTRTVYNDGMERETNSHNISIAFTVDPPTVRPWAGKEYVFFRPL